MVRALPTGAESPGFKTACERDFSNTLSVYPAGNEYPPLFRAGKSESGEEGE